MKNITKLKIIEVIIVVIVLLLCEQASITKSSTKTINSNLNKTLDLHAMAIKVEEMRILDMYTPIETYIGDLTGYVADCPLCSGKLGCNGQNVLDRTTQYHDKDYGNVRIVASSKSIPCGSIVQFNLPGISNNKITAIVLDRGVLGTDLDLLVDTVDVAKTKVGRKHIQYDILRMGYKR